MVIKFLKQYICCLAEFKNGRYEIGHVCVDDCELDGETKGAMQYFKESNLCITKIMQENDFFMLSLRRYENKKIVDQSEYIGHLLKEDDKYILILDKLINGAGVHEHEGFKFLIHPYHPEKNFFSSDFGRCILTSDGVVALDENQFIGVRDGFIEELDVREVLDILSLGETEKSPLFESLRLKPVSKRPSKPRAGTIIYNKGNKKLELYDGTDWKEVSL